MGWPATLCSMTLLQLHSWGQAFIVLLKTAPRIPLTFTTSRETRGTNFVIGIKHFLEPKCCDYFLLSNNCYHLLTTYSLQPVPGALCLLW